MSQVALWWHLDITNPHAIIGLFTVTFRSKSLVLCLMRLNEMLLVNGKSSCWQYDGMVTWMTTMRNRNTSSVKWTSWIWSTEALRHRIRAPMMIWIAWRGATSRSILRTHVSSVECFETDVVYIVYSLHRFSQSQLTHLKQVSIPLTHAVSTKNIGLYYQLDNWQERRNAVVRVVWERLSALNIPYQWNIFDF